MRVLVDWGTSSLRALLVTGDGEVLERRESRHGIQYISGGAFEQVLVSQIGPWQAVHGPIPVYAFGMIGSRNGWREMPYVDCPAGPGELVAAMQRLPDNEAGTVVLAPGVQDNQRGGAPDVMRGEEVYLLGLDADQEGTVILPGTHSKWAAYGDRAIAGFQTFVTGELFGLLAEHSFVAGGGAGSTGDGPAFDNGLAAGLSESGEEAGLLGRLFGVRTRMLAGQLEPGEAGSYLSGLLIGSEFREARRAGWYPASGNVVIVGSARQNARYVRAAERAGLRAVEKRPELFVTGARRLARAYEEINS